MDPTIRLLLRWTLVGIAVAMVVLIATGLWLVWNYRPSAAAQWATIRHIDLGALPNVRGLHRWTSRLVLILAVSFLVETIIGATMTRRVGPALAGVVLPTLAGIAAFSGALIAWDELALWAVTVGSNILGFGAIWSNHIRYVIVDHHALTVDTVRVWFVIHVGIVPLLIVVAVTTGIAVLARDQRASNPSSDRGSPPRETTVQ